MAMAISSRGREASPKIKILPREIFFNTRRKAASTDKVGKKAGGKKKTARVAANKQPPSRARKARIASLATTDGALTPTQLERQRKLEKLRAG